MSGVLTKSNIDPVLLTAVHCQYLNVSSLAYAVHLPPATVLRILGNTNKHSCIITAMRIADALGLTLEHIAHILLDNPTGRAETLIRNQMVKAELPSIRKLAMRAGMNISMVHPFITGGYQYMQLRNYRIVARGLNMNLDDFCKLLNIQQAGLTVVCESAKINVSDRKIYFNVTSSIWHLQAA